MLNVSNCAYIFVVGDTLLTVVKSSYKLLLQSSESCPLHIVQQTFIYFLVKFWKLGMFSFKPHTVRTNAAFNLSLIFTSISFVGLVL